MPHLSLFGGILVAWGVVTGILALLLIYRSVVAMKEDDQLFLESAESRYEDDQKAILSTLDRIKPYVKGLAFTSGGLLTIMIVLVTYRVVTAL